MSVFGRASMVVAALAGAGVALVVASGPGDLRAAAPAAVAGMRSAGALAFGPDGVLFVGDSRAAAVHALAIEEAQPDPSSGAVKVDHVDRKIAALLGTTVEDIAIHDMAVHPRTRAVYFSVSKGRGDAGAPVLVRSTLTGQMSIVTPRASGRLDLLDAPAEDAKTPWGESSRTMTVTDLAFTDGELLIAGLSNEAFASTLRRVPYPFATKPAATTLEIYHTSHGGYETAAPIETFLPFVVKGKPALLAGYGCAPLAAFELSALRGAKHLRGSTLAELGGGNRPHDMVAIERDGTRHVIVANTDRTLMRIAGADIDRSDPLTRQSKEMYESFGTPYISLAIVGVLQLDRLGSDGILMLQRNVEDGSLNLRSQPTKTCDAHTGPCRVERAGRGRRGRLAGDPGRPARRGGRGDRRAGGASSHARGAGQPAPPLRGVLRVDVDRRGAGSRAPRGRGRAPRGRRVPRAAGGARDPTRRRLTLLFDPGRIKRGLRGHEELGAPLQAGHRYRLEIDGGWRDGRGRPLGAVFSHELVAGPDDREAPDPSTWRLDPPVGDTAPLVVRFAEPLDRALLASRMAVEDAAGRRMAGAIDVDEGDRRWRFTPAEAWRPGSYRLRVAPDLEDVAGNNLRRLFDADLTRDRAPSAGATMPGSRAPLSSPDPESPGFSRVCRSRHRQRLQKPIDRLDHVRSVGERRIVVVRACDRDESLRLGRRVEDAPALWIGDDGVLVPGDHQQGQPRPAMRLAVSKRSLSSQRTGSSG